MAKNLSNNGIVLNQTIYPQHVSQSVDAFTGADDYDITVSGSFTVTGSTAIKGDVNIDGPTTMYGNVVAPNLTSTAQSNVVTFNPINGQLYYTASNAISPATASNAVSASYSATASYAEYAVSASYASTASWAINAITASYVTTAQTASYVLNAVSASYASTASYVANAQTASYVENAQTASYVTTAQTASYVTLAQTASYVTTAQTASYVLSASYAVSSSAADSAISASYSTTASFAQNAISASYAVSASHADLADTASYVTLAQTASYVLSASYAVTSSYSNTSTSSSYALTASYLEGYISPFPFTGSAQITGSLGLTGSAIINGDLVVNGTASFNVFHTIYNSSSIIYASGSTKFGDTSDDTHQFTGSLLVSGSITADSFTGTASYATQAATASFVTLAQTASYVANAQTASYVANAQTASYVLNAVSSSFATTASYVANAQTASFVTLAQTASYVATASYSNSSLSASYALTASYVTGVVAAFPYTGSAQITGSLGLTGSFNVYKSGSNVVVISGSTGPLVTVTDSNSGPLLTVATGSVNILVVDSSLVTTITGSLNVQSGVTASLFGTASWALNAITSSHIVQAVSASYSATASFVQLAQTASYVANAQTASYVLNAVSSSFATTASYALTASFVTTAQTASYVLNAVSSSFATTASYVNTASYALNAMSASYATTASYAVNGGVTQLFAGPNITLSPTTGVGQVTISSTGAGTYYNTSTGSYGSFYDTTTQLNPVANIPRSMSLNTTDITNGVSVSGSSNPFNTYIKITNAGVYNIQFSAQLIKTDSGTDFIDIWLRRNGVDLMDSATNVTLIGNNDRQVAAWNWFATAGAGDYYQIMWASADTDVQLLAEPATGVHPGIPSVIATVNRIDTFLSNTGSFSGSFNGVLNGTASYATQAATASYVVLAQTASFVTTAQTASYVLNAVSSSFSSTASYVNQLNQTVFISGSLNATGSVNIYKSGSSPFIVSGSNGPLFEVTDSVSGSLWTIYTGSSAIFDVSSNRVMTLSGSAIITGSLNVQNGITGSLFGTSSWASNAVTASYALTASYVALAQTASYVVLAQTASYVLNAVSSSFASTASYVNQLNQAVLISGSINATGSVNVYKSGSIVFAVSGSNGPLFDIADVVSGSLFTVWTGSNRILQANSDYTTLLGGASGATALFATNKTTANSGSTTLYNVPTATYDSIHIDYNIRSGSVGRAGNLFAMWSGSSVNQIETSASSFGDTSTFTFGVLVSGSNLALTSSVSTNGWTVKTIIRSI